jgi:hypothetical protein
MAKEKVKYAIITDTKQNLEIMKPFIDCKTKEFDIISGSLESLRISNNADSVRSFLKKEMPRFTLLIGDIIKGEEFLKDDSGVFSAQVSDWYYACLSYPIEQITVKDWKKIFGLIPDNYVGRVYKPTIEIVQRMIDFDQKFYIQNESKINMFAPIGSFPWKEGNYWGTGADWSYPIYELSQKYFKDYVFQTIYEKEGDKTSPYQGNGFKDLKNVKSLVTFAASSMENSEIKEKHFFRTVWKDKNKNGFLTVNGQVEGDEISTVSYLNPKNIESDIFISVEEKMGELFDFPIVISGGLGSLLYYNNVDSKLSYGFQNLVIYLIMDSMLSGKTVGESVFNIGKDYIQYCKPKYEAESWCFTYFAIEGDPSASLKFQVEKDIGFQRIFQVSRNENDAIILGPNVQKKNDQFEITVSIVVFAPGLPTLITSSSYVIIVGEKRIKHLIKYNVFNWCGNAQSKGLGVFA